MTHSAGRSLAIFAALLIPGVARAQVDSSSIIAKGVRSIAITATDRVTHLADVATVHIGYELFGPDQPTTYASASRASNAIVAALRSAGVPDDTIESDQQAVGPTEPYQLTQLPASERGTHAFYAHQTWTVRTSADSAARVLDIAVKAGANSSGNIEWSLKDPNFASAEAAAKALQRARALAEAMAAGLSVHLGQLLYASNEVEAKPVRPVAMLAQAKAENVAAPHPLAINARQIETSATVYAVFAIQ